MRARPPTRERGWRQDPEGRRENILRGAERVFAKKGFSAARMGDIARAARVAEGTIYTQFESKRALLIAVGERYGQRLAQAAFGDLGSTPEPPDVEQVVRNIFDFVRETEGPLIAFLLANQPDEGGLAQAANRAEMLHAIETALESWIKAGRIPSMNTRVAAELQFGLVETGLRCCFLAKPQADPEDYIEETSRALRAYLSPRGYGQD